MVRGRRWVWGIDLSFSRVPSVDWARDRLREGILVLVQDLWTGGFQGYESLAAVAPINLRLWREAGGLTAGYINSSPWYAPEVSVEMGRRTAGDEWPHLAKVFNDVELHPIQEDQIRRTSELIRAVGKGGDIYTAHWFWVGILGNPTWPWLKEYRLWNAHYDLDPDIDFGQHPYGPWTVDDLVGEQWRGSHHVAGVEVDANIFDLNYFAQEEEEEEKEEIEMITDEDIKRITDAVAARVKMDREHDTARIYVRKQGTAPVYLLTEGHELVHVVSPEVLTLQDPAWDIVDLPADHPIWKLRTVFPAGTPL